ncbi:NAD(P)-binding domain-containing protein [Streptomyces sp. NPDC047081]|uniref:NAD(P)-binding domain-containing protein n=1 Tax=Streptomyces sp. NPDC047081 TaxID=3154706 RepID=UPI0033DD1602
MTGSRGEPCVSVIGTGRMGAAMAARLREAGFPVTAVSAIAEFLRGRVTGGP